MHSGTNAAKEAANLIDLDSDPTKLIDLVAIGKQMLITRGALTTFSIANDVAKYFAIIPAMFIVALPGLSASNVMGLATPHSAVLSALIFNALIIPALIPLALRGVRFRPTSAEDTFYRNLVVYGAGGLIAPFIGIKVIDLLLSARGLEDCDMRDIMMGALRASLVTWVLCGIAYPLALTGLGQWLMPVQANGSLERNPDGAVIGSRPDRAGRGMARSGFMAAPRRPPSTDPNDPTKTVPAPLQRGKFTALQSRPDQQRPCCERLLRIAKRWRPCNRISPAPCFRPTC